MQSSKLSIVKPMIVAIVMLFTLGVSVGAEARVLNTDLGRWTIRDPLGYVDGVNAYEYGSGRPTVVTDSTGLCTGCGVGRQDRGFGDCEDRRWQREGYPIGDEWIPFRDGWEDRGANCLCKELEAKRQVFPYCDSDSPEYDPKKCCTQVCYSCAGFPTITPPAQFQAPGPAGLGCQVACMGQLDGTLDLCRAYPTGFGCRQWLYSSQSQVNGKWNMFM